jgi:hypothetical protein
MSFRRLVLSAALSLAMVYIAYPYFTLYRLANAVSDGDSKALSRMISWDQVRDGVKEDICDAVTEVPAAEVAREGTLPPFGYSFVRGVAANAVDTNISPEALVSAAHSPQAAVNDGMSLNWAFFDSPRRFSVAIGTGPAHPDGELRLQMDFRYGKWVVTRAWLPASMLMAANRRT